MKRLIFFIFSAFLILSSCEDAPIKGEKGSPLLKYFGDSKSDIAYSILETENGYALCGKLTKVIRDDEGKVTSENSDLGLIIVDKNGNEVNRYISEEAGFDEARKVISLSDGSFICVGTKSNLNSSDNVVKDTDILVVKISADGKEIAKQSFGDKYNQEGHDIIETSFGYIVVGSNDDYENWPNIKGNRNFYYLSLDSSLELLQSYTQGWETDEYAQKIVALKNSNYMVFGTTTHSLAGDTPGQAGKNIMATTIKVSSTEPPVAQFAVSNIKIWGGSSDEEFADAEVFDEENIALVGTLTKANDTKIGLFAPIDVTNITSIIPNIEFIEFKTTNVVKFNSVTEILKQGFMIAGTAGGTSETANMNFIFIDKEGYALNTYDNLTTGGTGKQEALDAVYDKQNKFVAVGINSYENNSLISFLKFDQLK